MQRSLLLVALSLALPSPARAQETPLPKPLVTGLKNPYAVAVGTDGRIYVVESRAENDKAGSGKVLVIDKGRAVPFAAGLNYPEGMVAWSNWLFVTDEDRVWRIDRKGKAEVFASPKAFPVPPQFLTGIAVDEQGTLYVSDTRSGAIFRINPKGKVSLVTDAKRSPSLGLPYGIVQDGMSHLLSLNGHPGQLLRIKIADGSATKIADGLGSPVRSTWDWHGRLFASDIKGGRVLAVPRPGEKPVELPPAFQLTFSIAPDPSGKAILVIDGDAGTLTAIPTQIPGWEVDETPLPLQTAVAFPDLQWAGWKGFTDDGKVFPLRPLILSHAGDGSDRVFVGIQQGTIHVFPNDQKATQTKIFLDIRDRVVYTDAENEQGFLGLAFHPNYKTNGEFFVFYTSKKAKMTNVLSRFRVSKDDPNKADPASEEVLLQIKRPYWNHDGGTICFGPDGYLYVTLGDGGAANDPYNNGQNLKTLLAKVLRIDVDKKDAGKKYAIPKDNPFVGKKDAAPETWAYGLRNIWRMAFDKKTGKLWAGEVGQNLYEEINIIEKGGNYGWSRREALHPFGKNGVDANKDMIDPIWEYHHDVGKSITGGHVYRGKRLPELEGAYLYGDFVTAKIWALWYDEGKKRVVANRPIRDPNQPILSFGEDEQGEVYFLAATVSGKGIYQFVKTGSGKR